jgi:hypothetical protein
MLKYLLDMLLVLNFVITIDQDVVHKRCHKVVKIIHKDFVNKPLERGWAIS